jgi:anti-sigma B factor antagonist
MSKRKDNRGGGGGGGNNRGLEIEAEQTPRGLIARIVGELGVEEVDELDRQLHLLTVLKPNLAVLDLSRVSFISSMAIGALVRFRNQVAEGGGRVALAGMQKNVQDSFLYTGLERVFALHKSVAEAVDAP